MSAADRGWGSGWPNCQPGNQVRVSGGGVSISCRREIAPVMKACLDDTAATGYVVRQDQTGAFVCRPIGGTRIPSNHSWGLAIDVNWRENPFTTNANAARTITDRQVSVWKARGFSWGGDWTGKKDFMHFEFLGTPADAARRVAALTSSPMPVPANTPPGYCSESHPVLRLGDSGRAVNHLQYLLIRGAHPIAGDGQYGPAVRAAVYNFQANQAHIGAEGVCGPETWRHLHGHIDGLKVQ